MDPILGGVHGDSALPGAVEPVLASAPLAAGAPASDWLMLSRPKALVPAHPVHMGVLFVSLLCIQIVHVHHVHVRTQEIMKQLKLQGTVPCSGIVFIAAVTWISCSDGLCCASKKHRH